MNIKEEQSLLEYRIKNRKSTKPNVPRLGVGSF